MEQIGEIVELHGRSAVVRLKRASACGENCVQCEGGCKPTSRTIKAVNKANAQVGDVVKLEMNSAMFMLLAFVGYILPIIAAIGAYLIADSLTGNTVIADAALIFTLIGMLVLFFIIDKLPRKASRFSTQIVKIMK